MKSLGIISTRKLTLLKDKIMYNISQTKTLITNSCLLPSRVPVRRNNLLNPFVVSPISLSNQSLFSPSSLVP
jgi:hypothetical protein